MSHGFVRLQPLSVAVSLANWRASDQRLPAHFRPLDNASDDARAANDAGLVGRQRLPVGMTSIDDSLNAPSVIRGPKYKTRMCLNYLKPRGCHRGQACEFAHGESELRSTPPRPSITSSALSHDVPDAQRLATINTMRTATATTGSTGVRRMRGRILERIVHFCVWPDDLRELITLSHVSTAWRDAARNTDDYEPFTISNHEVATQSIDGVAAPPPSLLERAARLGPGWLMRVALNAARRNPKGADEAARLRSAAVIAAQYDRGDALAAIMAAMPTEQHRKSLERTVLYACFNKHVPLAGMSDRVIRLLGRDPPTYKRQWCGFRDAPGACSKGFECMFAHCDDEFRPAREGSVTLHVRNAASYSTPS